MQFDPKEVKETLQSKQLSEISYQKPAIIGHYLETKLFIAKDLCQRIDYLNSLLENLDCSESIGEEIQEQFTQIRTGLKELSGRSVYFRERDPILNLDLSEMDDLPYLKHSLEYFNLTLLEEVHHFCFEAKDHSLVTKELFNFFFGNINEKELSSIKKTIIVEKIDKLLNVNEDNKLSLYNYYLKQKSNQFLAGLFLCKLDKQIEESTKELLDFPMSKLISYKDFGVIEYQSRNEQLYINNADKIRDSLDLTLVNYVDFDKMEKCTINNDRITLRLSQKAFGPKFIVVPHDRYPLFAKECCKSISRSNSITLRKSPTKNKISSKPFSKKYTKNSPTIEINGLRAISLFENSIGS